MALDFSYAPYELKVRGDAAPNAKSVSRLRRGALLRVNGGYADLHPWTELGDWDFKKQLDLYTHGHVTAQLARSLECAKMDADARQRSQSLFDGLRIPRSHFTVLDISTLEESPAEFDTIKVKVGKNLDLERSALLDFFKVRVAKLRLDFNSNLDGATLVSFLSSLPEEILDALDFVEDPVPYSATQWSELRTHSRLRFALDDKRLLTESLGQDLSGSFDVWVLKPAKEKPQPYVQAASKFIQRVVVTSYMDHPLGQLYAAFEAARLFRSSPLLLDRCGLLSHTIYEPNDFSSCFQVKDARLQPVTGAGLGFEELLKKQKWTKLAT